MSLNPVPIKKRNWMDIASQAAIFVGAIGALTLGSGSGWGFVIGLACQPFWYYTTYTHKQWGVFAASVLYTIGWSMGAYRFFFP